MDIKEVEILIFNKSDSNGYLKLSLAKQKDGQYDVAISIVRTALLYYPESAELHYRLSVLLNIKGDLEGANESINLALNFNETSVKYHEMKGNILWRKNDIEVSKAAYLRCIELNSNLVRPYFRLSKIFEKEKRIIDAIIYIETAIKLDSGNALYFFHYSELLVQQSNFSESIKYKLIAKSLDPLKYDFVESEVRVRCLLYSGELAIVPAGFRCYTKGVFYKKYNFKQPSLPFDSGFFPPISIATVLKNPIINITMTSHDVCEKYEKSFDDTLGLGIKFFISDYPSIDRLVSNSVKCGNYLDNTKGYYTLDSKNKFILAHYNWHSTASFEKSKGVYEPLENIKEINSVLNKRIERMFNICKGAKYVLFIIGNTQNYKYMSINDDFYDLYDSEELSITLNEVFGDKAKVIFLDEALESENILALINFLN
jgi:tetratricopeptide (TPR) repeat protein